ncbi:methanol O-anthraniloyltransferase-like, partial [Vigna umbellata]|uniref:methanol O-anthraniloyltransferase-like n=1 Tax=Vigna umbellata TaxID=87088 RepID=UPI001F5EF953
MSPRSFDVVHGGAELVVPAGPTPRELKNLSDIDDQEGLRFHLPVIMFYRNGSVVEGKDAGMLLVEAEADVSLRELGDKILPPCPYMKEFLLDVPGSRRILGTPLLLVQ